MEKSSQKHHTYQIGKCPKTSSCSPPLGAASLRILLHSPAASQDNGGYSGLHVVFRALTGPHPWGTKGLDLSKTFLILLLPRLCTNLSRQARRPCKIQHKCRLLQEALRATAQDPQKNGVLAPALPLICSAPVFSSAKCG